MILQTCGSMHVAWGMHFDCVPLHAFHINSTQTTKVGKACRTDEARLCKSAYTNAFSITQHCQQQTSQAGCTCTLNTGGSKHHDNNTMCCACWNAHKTATNFETRKQGKCLYVCYHLGVCQTDQTPNHLRTLGCTNTKNTKSQRKMNKHLSRVQCMQTISFQMQHHRTHADHTPLSNRLPVLCNHAPF